MADLTRIQGRPKKYGPEHFSRVKALISPDLTVKQIAAAAGVSTAYVDRVIYQLKRQENKEL